MKCINCGAPLVTQYCQYCGSNNAVPIPVVESSIKVTVSGNMNDVAFSVGDGEDSDIKISSNMGNCKYKTNKKIELYISGNMNTIKFKNVPYSLKNDSGHMNEVRDKS
jgi:hypothetical protein